MPQTLVKAPDVQKEKSDRHLNTTYSHSNICCREDVCHHIRVQQTANRQAISMSQHKLCRQHRNTICISFNRFYTDILSTIQYHIPSNISRSWCSKC